MAPQDPDRRVRPFLEELEVRRARLAGHILRASNDDPLRQVSYQPNGAEPMQVGKRRVGRPQQQWQYRTNEAVLKTLSYSEYDGSPRHTQCV